MEFLEIANKIFEAREMAHIYHLKTDSKSKHDAFEDFYEEAIEHLDLLIEVYQGQHGIIEPEKYQTIKSEYNDDYIEYFENFVENLKSCDFPDEDQHLIAIIEDMIILTYKTLYKLKYLK